MKDNKLWWEGPDWLTKSKEEWPKFEATDKTVLEEERKSVVMVVGVIKPAILRRVIDLNDYGTAERLFRVTAWVLRFGFNVRVKARGIDRQNGELTVNELIEEESIWIKEA